MPELIARWIDRIDNAAACPDDLPIVRLQKTLLIFLCASGVFVLPWGGLYFYGQALPQAAAVVLAYAALALIAGGHLLATRRVGLAAPLQLSALLIAPALLQWSLGGFVGGGAAILWALLSPVCALVFQGTRTAVRWFAAFALLVLAGAGQDIAGGVDQRQVLLYCENVLLVSALAFFALRFFMIERDKAQAALEREQARSEALLLNILPAPIAERLKAGKQTIADGYAEASILFADLVGFTQLSATVPPDRLVTLLNQLFSRFDELSGRFGVEKIKTIGDAYMACAGVPVARPDHAEAVAEMALAMREAVAAHNREFGSALKIRIGINSGPVVAGVIGLKKFIYDLWGDTVNFASRMESHGLPDCIQVSATTRQKLGERYEFESRGSIEVKGIGQVEAFLLKGRRPPA